MARRSKMNAKRHEAVVGGQKCKFDSMAERRYAEWLERERKAKRIKAWAHHNGDFALHSANGDELGHIEPDFRVTPNFGIDEWHEVKGLATPLWRWKRKHLLADYDIPYRVIDAGRGVCATGKGEPALFDERPRRKRRKK